MTNEQLNTFTDPALIIPHISGKDKAALHASSAKRGPTQHNKAEYTLFLTNVLSCHLFDRSRECDSYWMQVLSHFVGREDSQHRPLTESSDGFQKQQERIYIPPWGVWYQLKYWSRNG